MKHHNTIRAKFVYLITAKDRQKSRYYHKEHPEHINSKKYLFINGVKKDCFLA